MDAAGAVTTQRWTTHSDGVDDLLAVTLNTGTTPATSSYYYHTDHQGSVRAITDQNGAVTNAYAYDSYGTAEESVELLAQRFRYTGREFDALTGLYHYRARAYDPQTARFLQEDPLHFKALQPKRGLEIDDELVEAAGLSGTEGVYASELNVYRYVSSNPVIYVDPTGKFGAGIYSGAVKRVQSSLALVNTKIRHSGQALLTKFPRNSAGRLFDSFTGRYVTKDFIREVRKDYRISFLKGLADGCMEPGKVEATDAKHGWGYMAGHLIGAFACGGAKGGG